MLGGTAKVKTDGWFRWLNGSGSYNLASIMLSIIEALTIFGIA
jgi:hypothetical protein